MKLCSFGAAVLLLATTVLLSAKAHEDEEYVIRWSSTGGGWRAMFACIGYANAFQQAGLFRGDKSRFSAIAVNSGAAWFATQLFYSEAFYKQTINASPDELYDFTIQWMDSYLNLLNSVTNTSSSDDSLDDITNTSNLNLQPNNETDQASDIGTYLEEFFALFAAFDGDWAYFIEQMLAEAAAGYGHEGDFVNTRVNGFGRLPPMNATELLVQTALSPTARTRYTPPPPAPPTNDTNTTEEEDMGPLGGLLEEGPQDQTLYLGPVDGDGDVYTVVLSTAYIANDTYQGFQYATFDSDPGSLATYMGTTPSEFDFDEWEDFYLFADRELGTVLISDLEATQNVVNMTVMKTPFSGGGMGGGPGMGMGPPGAGFGPPGQGQGPPPGGQGGQGPPPGGQGGQGPPPQGGQGGQGPPPQGGQGQGPPPGGGQGQGGPPPGAGFGPPGNGFGGPGGGRRRAATVTQVAAISSAAVGVASPAIPSIFAQTWSKRREDIDGVLATSLYDGAVASIYDASSLDNIAVCGQWPNECEPGDGWFVDGGFADNPSFAINIAQYHQSNADIGKPMKVVLTNTGQSFNETYNYAQLLQYFSADFNQGIEPGEYVWIPTSAVPRRSPQVFGEAMDAETLFNMQEPFDNSNMTSCILTGTTIDNPAFGIRAGQSIEVLLLSLNEPITTFIAGQTVIEQTTIPLAEMVKHIASHQQLMQRVQDFFYPNGIPEDHAEVDTTPDAGAGGEETEVTSDGEASEGASDPAPSEGGETSENGGSETVSVNTESAASGRFLDALPWATAILIVAAI